MKFGKNKTSSDIKGLQDSAIADSDAYLSNILASTSDAIISIDVDQRIVQFNAGAEQIFGYTSDEILGESIEKLIPPAFRAGHAEHISAFAGEAVTSRRMNDRSEIAGCRKDGEAFPAEASITKAEIGGQTIFTVILRDISGRKRTEDALHASEDRYRSIIENMADTFYRTDIDGRLVMASPSAEELLGYTPDEVIGMDLAGLYADPEGRAKFLETLSNSTGGVRDYQAELRRKDGSTVWVSSNAQYVRDSDGNVTGVEGTVRDITEKRQAERAVVESRDQLRLVTDNLPVLIVYIDAQKRYRFANKTCSEWYALPIRDILEKTVPEVLGDEFTKFNARIARTLAGELQTFVETVTYPDGVTRTVQVTYIPHREADGSIDGYFSLTEDISELQRTEEALRQAQKMEAVGQLTGGVAHDFNNLLAVILGNTELLQDEIGDHNQITLIDRAATRGAELIQRLLSFSRQQALQPQSIDLTELLPSLDELFRRTLGAQINISMEVPEGVWPVTADPGQLENALLNLAINARDAMPDGGVLEIRCENTQLPCDSLPASDEVAAGDYVQIAVRDTGAGMPEEVREHAFEPFYTTKDVGEGSGLGLSMVYGFARQSGGNAIIESEPGTGTEIKLLLPRSEVTTMTDELLQGKDRKRGQGETILVLEDDPDVRSFAVNALQGLGYQVHEAADATAAMQVLEDEADKLDLLLSDVVLPGGVSGPEFVAKARDLFPDLKLVFMSGYAADLYTKDKIPGFDEILLTKPFRLAELADAVHGTLAG
jgi:PAS domain S-box-containing protein